MLETVKNIIHRHGIKLSAPIKLSDCILLRPHKFKKVGLNWEDQLYAVMLAVPYLSEHSEGNISAYAVPFDYHLYFQQLFDKLLPALAVKFPGYRFCGFADDSPIDERDAAAKAGLGMIGDNQMLITEAYSSYVFLGEIITDLPLSEAQTNPVKHCEGCGACKKVCPMNETGICLSALTQKKGELTAEEQEIILKYGSAWGCDLCQEVCPHTKKAFNQGSIYTNIPFFKEGLIFDLTVEQIKKMPDEDFVRRAYSWRKKETILRNLNILEKQKQISDKDNL